MAQQHTTLPNSSLKLLWQASSFVKDNTDFIQKIKHVSINPEEETLVLFDVSALQQHTSTCCTTSYQFQNFYLHQLHNVCKIPIKKFIKLLEFTISNCILCFNNKLYKQLQGEARGSHISPIIANSYLEHFESLGIPISPTLMKWWFRYVDDAYSATRKDQVNKLQEHLNSIYPHVKFTIELPGTDGLSFPDTLTKPTPNSIESTIYRKPTHTYRYSDNNSNHPISAELSVIHTLIHRAKQVCSTPEFLAKEIDHLHKVLQDNHYPAQFLQQGKL